MYWFTSSRLHDPQSCPRRCRHSASVGDSGEAAIRLDRIQRIREEIAAGTYDTPEKFEAAFATLLEQLD